jgi:hypothetical protein
MSLGDFLNTVVKWERRATPGGRTSILMGLEKMQLFMATQYAVSKDWIQLGRHEELHLL